MPEITGITHTKPGTKKTVKGKKKRKSSVNYVRLYDHLTKLQKDVLGEVANISMGNSATTLSMMLNHPVNITAPHVDVILRSDALEGYEGTCTFVQIHYIKGLSGSNVFVLKDEDMLCITDMMMGGAGKAGEMAFPELNEMHMSAASEAMNQMMGTSATSMSSMLATTVDISTPSLSRIDVDSVKTFDRMFHSPLDYFVRITFHLVIDERIDSTMIQLYPIQFAVDMCKLFRKKKLDKKETVVITNEQG
ncbi:MAG: chemotaxis protein CheC [Lachnospiraceae bacterium]|nr:chemotaxis protein CheC [Lachnospiraceae bacterium]MBR0091493.1 chemotaxis protein CheC [Lachnospiraceae bacterium]